MFKEHDQVVLTRRIPELGLEPGDVGVVIHVNKNGKVCEVEFMTLEGKTIGTPTIELTDVRPVGHAKVPRVRERFVAYLDQK